MGEEGIKLCFIIITNGAFIGSSAIVINVLLLSRQLIGWEVEDVKFFVPY